MSVSVCLCVRVCLSAIISPELHVRFHQVFFIHVTYGRGSILLWRRSDMLRISGFVDDVIFAHSAARRRRQTEAVRLARTQPWAWRVGIPVAGSGRSGLLLAVRAY